jgi:hypothetical protein
MMTTTQFTKFLATLAFTLLLFNHSFAQIVPDETLGAGESVEWFYNASSSNHPGLGPIFKLGKVIKQSGNSASATKRIRISMIVASDFPCVAGDCMDDVFFTNLLAFKKDDGLYEPLSLISLTVPSGFAVLDSLDNFDTFTNATTYLVSSLGCGFAWLGPCYGVLNTVYGSGAVNYVLGKSGYNFTTPIIKELNGWHTVTFDWIDFPVSFLDGDVEFLYESEFFSEDFTVDFGNEVLVEDLQTTSNDNEVTIAGSSTLNSCATVTNHSRKWLAVSNSIYGDTEMHVVDLGDWENDFSLSVLSQSGSENLGPGFSFDYKLYYQEYDKGCAIQRVFELPTQDEVTSTNPLVQVDNILALNFEDDVKVQWSQKTSVDPSDLSYLIKRKEDPDNENWKNVFEYNVGINVDTLQNINYTLNSGTNEDFSVSNDNNYLIPIAGNPVFAENITLSDGVIGQFIDHTADPAKTYLYSIDVKVKTDHVITDYVHQMSSTGAGIPFFDDNTELNILSPIPGCDEFTIAGTQNTINSNVYFADEEYLYNSQNQSLSFIDFSGNAGQAQRVYFYSDKDLTIPVLNPLDDSPLVLPGSETNINNFNLPLAATEFSKTMYGVIRATRADGKVFQSFRPREIVGNRKPKPTTIELNGDFEEYVTLRFTDIRAADSYTDNIKIVREKRNPGTETTSDPDEVVSLIIPKSDFSDLIVESTELVWKDTPENGWPKTELCNTYTYQIQSSNCNIWSLTDSEFYEEVKSNEKSVTPTLKEDIFVIGNSQKDLSTTKGEFSDKIHLSWNNNSSGIVSNYTIERRQYGSVGESAWIELASLSSGEKYFQDTYSEANLLYEYRIKAHVGNCAENSNSVANTVSSKVIGYRRPVGRVTGRIVYNQTTNPVSDVYVKVEPIINEDQSINRSLDLDSNYAIVSTPFSNYADELDEYSLNFWMKSNADEKGYLFSRFNELHKMSLYYNQNTVRYEEYSGSLNEAYTSYNLKPEPNSWNNITLTYKNNTENQDSVKLYVNGQLMGSYQTQFIPTTQDNFIFGVDREKSLENSFDGLIDEVVVWKKELSAKEISENYYKFLNTSDDDLIFFLSCDEGIGQTSYDISSNTIDIYNRNHMELKKIDSPTFLITDQLNYFYSNDYNTELLNLDKSTSSGMYDITNIRYIGEGNNFSITPYTILNETYNVIHEFVPSQRTDFIGDQSLLLSAIDFSDLTSLSVQGTVLFDVTEQNSGFDLINKETNRIGVSDAFVKIGGKRINSENGQVKTDENGAFAISIPIGNQCISFEKNGYTFSYTNDTDLQNDDKFCMDFEFNSEQNLPDFSCNTYKELRGRITGGNTYGFNIIEDLKIGFDIPANTIGSVGFSLMPNEASVIDYDGYSVNVTTDSLSGEYHAKLLPIIHKINSASWISSNKSVEDKYKYQQYNFSTIDMNVEGSNDVNGDFIEDVIISTYGTVAVQTVEFHKRHDITYRNNPSILVSQNISSQLHWGSSLGDKLIELEEGYSIPAYDSTGYLLGKPIYKERYGSETYRFNIEVSEVYKNYGPIKNGHSHNNYMYKDANGESVYNSQTYYNEVDQGEITINNTMMKNSFVSMSLEDLNGSVDYSFNPDNPYVFGKEQGYLRKFIIEYQDGSLNAKWPNLRSNENESNRGDVYVFGDESYGNDFFTFGPQIVDMILRDPNGDASYSSIEEGSTITRTSSITNVNGYSKDWDFHAGAGIAGDGAIGFSLGAHTEVAFSAKAFATLDMTNSVGLTNTSENEITISETYNQTISTNQDDWEVGAKGDLYLGESKNLNFGVSKDLNFIESNKCSLGGGIFDCLDYPKIKQSKSYVKQTVTNNSTMMSTVSFLDPVSSYEIAETVIPIETIIVSDSTYVLDGQTYLIEYYQEVASYQIGTKKGATIKPGVTTKFVYSQNYVQNYLLTKLAFIKNTYLLGEYDVNTNLVPVDHECFGEPSVSTCFDSYPDSIRNYYTIPESSTEEYFELPVLSSYDINTLTAILGTTYQEFQQNYNDADHYIGYSVSDAPINNDQWNDPLISLSSENSGFGFSISSGVTPELVQYLNFVNTGPLFGTGLDIDINAYIGLNGNTDDLSAYGDTDVNTEDGETTVSAGGTVSVGGIDAGISVDISLDDDASNDSYANEAQLNGLLANFANVQDFTSVPGFINLQELMGSLTLSSSSDPESVVIPRDKVQFYAQQIKLWKRAMAMNELDKIESQFVTNHSLNGGVSIGQSHTSVGSYSNKTSIQYDLSSMNGLGGEFEGTLLIVGFDANFAYNDNYTLEFNSTTTLSGETESTTGYFLHDDDQGDIMSIDVNQSNYGFGPIFKFQAGATSCPWEDAVNVKYIKDFDLYFELKFYEEFLLLSVPMPTGLSFNSSTYDFVYEEQITSTENKFKKASYVDYSLINRKHVSSRTSYEAARYAVYDLVKTNLLQTHTSMFGSGAPYEISATTSQRDKPTIDVYPYNLYNVPEEEQAVFNLVLGNESEDNSNRIYNIKVLESSNPYGAIIEIDGLSPNRDFSVPAGGVVNKTLTLRKGPDSLNYKNIQLIIYPECQYDQGTSNEYHIADTISFSAYFLPTCTELAVYDNDDDWLVNISDSNIVSIKLDNYNINYYSLEDVYFDYKFQNEPWSPISPNPSIVNPNHVINKLEKFKSLSSLELYNMLHSDFNISPESASELYKKLEPREDCKGASCVLYDESNVHENWKAWKEISTDTLAYIQDEIIRLKETHLSSGDAVSDNEMLSLRTSSTNVLWALPMLPKDGNYKIRAKSNCGSYTSQTSSDLEEISVYSSTHDIFVDRIRPELFGSIQPNDGILNPNDDVIITFNEPINEIAFNTSSAQTFVSVEASKNRTTHTHDSYLYFGSNDSLNIPSGVYLNQSFTIEMWVKPTSNGVLFEQSNGGDSEVIKFSIVDFDSNPKLQFEYIHPTDEAKNQIVNHAMAISSSGFTHTAVAYDSENNQIIFLDGTGEINVPEYTFNMNYIGDGPILIGAMYQGAMHDLRIWNKIADNIEANRSVNLSGNEANLVGYWPMDELRLNPKDKARYRHAVTTAQWSVDSDNKSFSLDYVPTDLDDFSQFIYPSPVSIANSSDFTIELWFNSDFAGYQTIFSLGSWNFGDSFDTWSIDLNSGIIEVHQGGANSESPILNSYNTYNDGQWHHMAIIKSAKANTRLYLDGLEIDQVDSELVGGIASSSTYLGLRRVVNFDNGSFEYTNHFNGLMDEIRIWNIAKSNDRLLSDMNTNITEKVGLLSSIDFNFEADFEAFSFSELNVPLIRASEPKTSVSNYDVSNGNQISIQITEPLNKIENTSIDFTIQNVKDLSGNYIENPISWSTYVDKNQLIWDNEFIEMEKLLGESLTFSTHIINQGGTVEDFEITNLPLWLNAYPSEGLLGPNSFVQIEFVVNDDLFIGDYYEDILLIGNNNYGERMEFNLNVEMLQPEHSVNAQDYEYVMNFVGKVTVEGIRSRDNMDILFAYIGDELRGAASPVFVEEYDAYFIFLSAYGDYVNGEELTFRLWDASEGKFQSRVKINGQDTHDFQPSFVIGSFTDLAHFEATNILRQDIVLNTGWNWLSFNLNSLDEVDGLDHVLQIPTVTSEVNGSSVSIFKNQTSFTQYAEIDGYPNTWIGSLTELPITDMYMIKTEQTDTIVYEGKIVNPSEVPISVGAGWNWIGYLGQRIMNTNDALSSLNPSSGDVIKNKTAFSMYASESLGWLGTLNSMESGSGYMLKTSNSGSLIYPESSIYRIHDFQQNKNQNPDMFIPVNTSLYQNSMSMVARIDLPQYDQPDLSNVLAAYSDQLCLGNIKATPISEYESLYFITIYGEEGYDVSFKYYDDYKELLLNAENCIDFVPNKLIGSVQDPYPIVLSNVLDVGNTNAFSIYPNPFEDVFEIEFILENKDYINIDIYDVTGRKVSSLYEGLFDSGIHKIKIEATDIAKGSYFIELKLQDSSIRKTIVKS